MVEENVYIAVKASLHANETSVFGLDKDELCALSKRFVISPEVINGYTLTSNPINVINSLSELGYKVVCSSGETEIVWTLRRTFIRPLIDSPNNVSGSEKEILVRCQEIFILLERMTEHHCCSHEGGTNSVCQSLDEMDFERGIWSAALDGDRERVRKLLEKGSQVDALDASGYTALHYAARTGHLSVCELLIGAGADINAQTRAGHATPLHRAVSAGKENIVSLLLRHGANRDIKDGDGNTCLQRAVKSGNQKVIEMLQQT